MPETPAPMKPSWRLQPIGAHGPDERVEISDGHVTLGRDPSADVTIDKAKFPQVSGHHARVKLGSSDNVFVEDLGSSNGTLVNGEVVTRQELRNGDVIQLGRGGPRFAIVRIMDFGGTLTDFEIPESALADAPPPREPEPEPPPRRPPPKRDFGHSTITNLRALLGIEEELEQQQAEIRQQSRRNRTLAVSAIVLVAAIAIGGWRVLSGIRAEESAELQSLRDLAAALNDRVETAETERATAIDTWREERQRIESERAALEQKIGKLVATGEASAGELASLREQLSEASESVKLFDPVNLEQARLRDVARVREAVVLVEASTYFQDRDTGKRLYIEVDAAGRQSVNLSGRGKPYLRESTGSGYCASQKGWIITNAHVARPPSAKSQSRPGSSIVLDPVTELKVVFSSTDRRLPAVLVKLVTDNEEDLALLKVQPFDGMPYMDGPDVNAPPPEPGSEVYLFGFPLGKMVLQEGNRVIASTFKGILSRRVGGFIQIDAAVHPGNSGGPLTDSHGRVVGIVSQVQVDPQSGGTANAIGYVIPAERLSKIWPPPDGE